MLLNLFTNLAAQDDPIVKRVYSFDSSISGTLNNEEGKVIWRGYQTKHFSSGYPFSQFIPSSLGDKGSAMELISQFEKRSVYTIEIVPSIKTESGFED